MIFGWLTWCVPSMSFLDLSCEPDFYECYIILFVYKSFLLMWRFTKISFFLYPEDSTRRTPSIFNLVSYIKWMRGFILSVQLYLVFYCHYNEGYLFSSTVGLDSTLLVPPSSRKTCFKHRCFVWLTQSLFLFGIYVVRYRSLINTFVEDQ